MVPPRFENFKKISFRTNANNTSTAHVSLYADDKLLLKITKIISHNYNEWPPVIGDFTANKIKLVLEGGGWLGTYGLTLTK